jgi:tetratricopeptide (TPR) repeat protein
MYRIIPMYRIILCAAAALLTFGTATRSAAATDDREACGRWSLTEEAVAACSRLIERNPKDADAYHKRGKAYYYLNNYDRAIADYDEAVRLTPKDVEVYKDRALVYKFKHDYDRAIADMDQAVRLAPEDAKSYKDRASVYESRHDYDRAIADLDQAVRLSPKDAEIYKHRAWVHLSKRDYDRAIADYGQAITLAPKDTDTYHTYLERGDAHNGKSDYDRAIADFDQAIGLRPKDTLAYHRRGNTYRRKGEYDRAIADYDEAIRLDGSCFVYVDRGEAYHQKRDYDRAIADADQAIKCLDPEISINPNLDLFYVARGRAYRLKHDHNRAIADFDQAIRLNAFANRAFVYNVRGEAYVDMGDYDRAIADYDQALKLDPSLTEARQNRARAQALAARLTPAKPVAAAPPPPPPPQAALPQPASQPVLAERRVALVIGNSQYRSVPVLPNPRRDAQAVAQALREDGFQTVMVVNDAGRDALRDALRRFRAEADKAEWALVYYAGHGVQIGKTNYLIPVDAKLADARDVQGETIAYGEVEAAVGGASTLRIIVLDACRTDPFETQMARANPGRAVARGLSPPPETDAGMLVVYSAKDGQVAEDGDGANSPFAAALVAQLKVPGREVRRLFDYVREDVMNATGRRQQPFTYGSLPGSKDFFFVAGK